MEATTSDQALEQHAPPPSNVINLAGEKAKDQRLAQRVQERLEHDPHLSVRAIASLLDLSHQSVKRYVDGKSNAAEAAKLRPRIIAWLGEGPELASVKGIEVDSALVTAKPGDFVETRSARQILHALAYTKAAGLMSVVFGGPGVGKTTTVNHFIHAYPHVWRATMRPAISTVVPALEEIAEAIGSVDAQGGARRIARLIAQRVRGLEKPLLVIDEAQHLKTGALEEIRSIHDETGIGVALVGNEAVYSRVTGAGTRFTHPQLSSRLGLRVYLERPKADDVKALLGAMWGVTDAAIVAELERVSALPGALRLVVQIMRLVEKGGDISVNAVRTACDSLGIEA